MLASGKPRRPPSPTSGSKRVRPARPARNAQSRVSSSPGSTESPNAVRRQSMQPRIHVVTLAVDDLERALAFYRDGLGFESPGIIGTEFVGDARNAGGAAAMFDLEGGLMLSLYGRDDLAKDAGIPVGTASSGEFSLGHLVPNREDVDAVLAEA